MNNQHINIIKKIIKATDPKVAEEIIIYLTKFLHNQTDSLTKYNLMTELIKLATQYEVNIQ